VTVKLVVFPAARAIGVVKPETLTPVPEIAILEIVALSLPVFVTFTVCVAVLPTVTVPKAIEAGDTVSPAAVVPVPLRATNSGELGALLVIVIVPVSWLSTVGLKAAETLALWPALNETGSLGPEAVNPVPVTEIAETVNISVPLFVSVTVCVALWPTATVPKLMALDDRAIALPGVLGVVPLPVVPTQPEATKIASRAPAAENARRTNPRVNRRERIASYTRARSKVGADIIERIVRWDRLPELLVAGTYLGQGPSPVREDSLLSLAKGQRWFGYSLALQSLNFSHRLLSRNSPVTRFGLRNHSSRLVRIRAFDVTRINCGDDIVVGYSGGDRRVCIVHRGD
jgi:hypothetical protein